MKKMMLIVAPVMAMALTACDLLDAPSNLTKMKATTEEMKDTTKEMKDNMENMKSTTQEMSDKMGTTNAAIHKQTLVAALDQMDKAENQAFTYPIPTGIMAAAKVFAEEIHPDELIEFMYIRLRELEEVDPVSGLDKDGYPIDPTPEQANQIRLQKKARLASLQAVAAFAQDEKVDAIIQNDIKGHGRYEETGYNFLALRASFLRDIMLRVSLKLDKEFTDENLTNSGMMNEAIKYLVKLDKISKLSFADKIQVDIKDDANPDFIKFTEKQDLEGRKRTAQLWQDALDKAQAGTQSYSQLNKDISQQDVDYKAEVSAQQKAMAIMQSYIDSWKPLIPQTVTDAKN
jgi:hypothetical protein